MRRMNQDSSHQLISFDLIRVESKQKSDTYFKGPDFILSQPEFR